MKNLLVSMLVFAAICMGSCSQDQEVAKEKQENTPEEKKEDDRKSLPSIFVTSVSVLKELAQ